MNFHTLIARNGGRRREIGAGEVSGENHHFPAAGAAADLGGGLGRDAEAEPDKNPHHTILLSNSNSYYLDENDVIWGQGLSISHNRKLG
ncbi:hypothetical protein L3X38_014372 [Prunus dulcis]|uniref:Uncharacterized protein n=1 Tax=Prunus dulcis TaxID=3755 RepID=A0AAD4WN21_PRUDU|nr:hypothetical protein L3X38_014369 [Prunus dulcis]KAI5346493.1 hypothetical protein L3X38_014372 [Prunus dulcis]